MISGVVTSDREAIIRLQVHGGGNHQQIIEAVIDTGFDGWLTLPPVLISGLDLPWRRRGRALVADGSDNIFDIYEATVIWDGQPRRVSVDEVDTSPLVGMALLGGYELTMQVRSGGKVSISPLG